MTGPVMRGIRVLLLAALPLCAQEAGDQNVFRAETNLATVAFHVKSKDAYVDSLTPRDIMLLEDGIPKPLAFLEGGATARRKIPIEIAVLFDSLVVDRPGAKGATSRAELTKVALNLQAFKSSVLDALPNAWISVYRLDNELWRLCRPTRDPRELSAAFLRLLSQDREGEKIELSLPPGRKERTVTHSYGYFYRLWPYEAVIAMAKDGDAASKGVRTRMLLTFSMGLSATTSTAENSLAETDPDLLAFISAPGP